MNRLLLTTICCCLLTETVFAAPPADQMLAAYFERETAAIRDDCLADIRSIEDWKKRRPEIRAQLMEMLGLHPTPEKTPLNPVTTGKVERDGIIVERVHFQSRPGMYVTGNLYRPKAQIRPVPAVLYVCGHGRVFKDGVSYGNKVHYHHHGAWFARNGYVCLTIDSVQLGEIESIHHGTYRYDMWWWLCRGYTPAGPEAWNCVRALDYLESRQEVDEERLGVTGRSGGGAYSWWIAAIDDRIKVAVPVAGITDMEDHVVNGCVEGHCDCMYMLNTFRWDYPQVAALVAPRHLLISNTDRDSIFPLSGVVRTHRIVRRIYGLHDAPERLALNISAGPHKDTQDLRINAFRWFNHFLNYEEDLITDVADARFEPQELKVFDTLPKDERNTSVHEWFVAKAEAPAPPTTANQWSSSCDRWREVLNTRVFAAWPKGTVALDGRRLSDETDSDLRCEVVEFTSQPSVRLPLLVVRPTKPSSDTVNLRVLDQAGWEQLQSRLAHRFPKAFSHWDAPSTADKEDSSSEEDLGEGITVFLPPRGIGPTAWSGDERKQVQIRRRFYLLGQSLDGMRVWDVRRAVQMLDQMSLSKSISIHASGRLAGVALYASLFEPNITSLNLTGLPSTHRHGPYLLNVMRYLDIPQAVAMATEKCQVTLRDAGPSENWSYVEQTAKQLGWPERFTVVKPRP